MKDRLIPSMRSAGSIVVLVMMFIGQGCVLEDNLELGPSDMEDLPKVKGPENIQRFDSYSDDSSIQLFWTTGRPPIDFPVIGPHDPVRKVKTVRLFLSETHPDEGYEEIFRVDRDGRDSLSVESLKNGNTCYFRLATYDSVGTPIGLSRPLMTQPGKFREPVLSLGSNQVEPSIYVTNLSWSPNGDRIAFIRDTSPGTPNIYIFDLVDEEVTKVTDYADQGYRLLSVAWSPDGSRLAYCYTPTSGYGAIDYRIWVYSLLDGRKDPVSSGRVDFDPTWYNDTTIVFCKGTHDPPNIPELLSLNLVSSSETAITKDQLARKYEPSVSPIDGTIIYSSEKVGSGMRSLNLISISGQDRADLTEYSYWREIHPSWSPDGQEIVFSSNRSGHYEIWAIEILDGTFRQISHGVDKGVGRFSPKWSPDGSRIAFINDPSNYGGTSLDIINIDR